MLFQAKREVLEAFYSSHVLVAGDYEFNSANLSITISLSASLKDTIVSIRYIRSVYYFLSALKIDETTLKTFQITARKIFLAIAESRPLPDFPPPVR